MPKKRTFYSEEERKAHAEINDEGQTVKIKNPEIGTKATADGKKEITADKITITDVVSYTDLTPGKEYNYSILNWSSDTYNFYRRDNSCA